MSVAQEALYGPVSWSTITTEGPGVKVGGSFTAATQKRIVAGAEYRSPSKARYVKNQLPRMAREPSGLRAVVGSGWYGRSRCPPSGRGRARAA